MPVILIKPKRFEDSRGWFAVTYNRERFAALGVDVEFVQDNHSLSRPAGVLRGLHYQHPPHAQAKLVRCVRGRIWDVAVDIRAGSPTFGQSVTAELTAGGGEQLFVPAGFAHGFVTLEPDTEVVYKASAFYAPQADAGFRWDSPGLGLDWPLPPGGPVLSEKDERLPTLNEIESPFVYDGRPLVPLEA